MSDQIHPDNPAEPEAQAAFIAAVAPEAVEILEDGIAFPNTHMLPITVRSEGPQGMHRRPWARLRSSHFHVGTPLIYSIALRSMLPDMLRSKLRMRRTVMEGVLMALAEKTGRRPSRAEQQADTALDDAESRLALGEPAYQAALITGLYAAKNRASEAISARRQLENRLRARGFIAQRLMYIAERALLHLQPGGMLFPGIHEPVLMLDEAVPLLPRPERSVSPPPGAVYLGTACRDGRDIYYSPLIGLDTGGTPAAHATCLVLGEMGSGKTSLMRSVMLQRLMQGRRIISLDPEGENNNLCRALNGSVVPAGQPSEPDVCLLQPLEAGSAGEMLFAVRFLVAALGGKRELAAGAQAALHDVVQDFWSKRPARVMTLTELHDALPEDDPDVSEVRALLRPFIRSSLWGGFFDRERPLLHSGMFDHAASTNRCDSDESAAWWNFDLSGLREENKTIVLALLTWFLYRVISIHTAPVDIFLDEGWRLMQAPSFAGLLDELGRRARKRGIGIFITTHLPSDFDTASSVLGLASMIFTGRLGTSQAEGMLKHIGMSPDRIQQHAERIAQLPPHHFFAVPAGGRSSQFDFQVRIPPDWLTWWQAHGAAR